MPPGGVSSNARRDASFQSASSANSGGRALADQRAAARAHHLLEEAVAALDHPAAHESDADGGVVEDQVLLGQRALHAQLRLALDGDVLVAPDPLLLLVPGVGAPPARAAHEGRAVAPAEARLAVVGAAGRGRRVRAPPGLLPVGARREQARGALADQLAGPGADHVLQIAVAALDRAVAHEGDADRGVVEDQLLLGERALHALLGFVLLRDVVEQPDRALRRIARLHRAPGERAPDRGAVLAQVAPLGVDRLAAPQRLVKRFAARLVVLLRGEHEARRAVEQLAVAVAEDLLEAPVAAHDAPVLDEDDAGDRVLQHRVLLAHQALERLVRAAALADVLDQPDIAARRDRRRRPRGPRRGTRSPSRPGGAATARARA